MLLLHIAEFDGIFESKSLLLPYAIAQLSLQSWYLRTLPIDDVPQLSNFVPQGLYRVLLVKVDPRFQLLKLVDTKVQCTIIFAISDAYWRFWR